MKFQSRPKAPKLELHSAAGTAQETSINFYSVYVSLGWNYVVKGEKCEVSVRHLLGHMRYRPRSAE